MAQTTLKQELGWQRTQDSDNEQQAFAEIENDNKGNSHQR